LSLSACLAPASPSPGSSRGPWSATRFITEGDIDVKQVIQASGVMPYEPYGFTNCLRFKDLQGRVIGDDIETQTVHTYQNIERVLRAGGSDLDQILQMTSFIVDLEKNGAGYVAARKTIMTRHTYTSATIGISALMVPGLLLEVQCTAAAP
jgi:enamine deaminase RidA (YjgF/YER057c/UK114 family)